MEIEHNQEYVTLVNQRDEVLGSMEKLEAHQKGALHRAFSIFIFNKERRLLLQRRAQSKYHSPGLWTNTCCGHPRPGETSAKAAQRRLFEEMGFTCELENPFNFTYEAEVGIGLLEHELDHVYFGYYHGPVRVNPDEASDTRWMRMNDLADDLRSSPDLYTKWLHVCWPRVLESFRLHRQKT